MALTHALWWYNQNSVKFAYIWRYFIFERKLLNFSLCPRFEQIKATMTSLHDIKVHTNVNRSQYIRTKHNKSENERKRKRTSNNKKMHTRTHIFFHFQNAWHSVGIVNRHTVEELDIAGSVFSLFLLGNL